MGVEEIMAQEERAMGRKCTVIESRIFGDDDATVVLYTTTLESPEFTQIQKRVVVVAEGHSKTSAIVGMETEIHEGDR